MFAVTMGEPLPLQWEDLIATPVANGNKIQWTLHSILDAAYFEIQRSVKLDFIDFTKVAEIAADPDKFSYGYHDPFYQPTGVYYRIAAHMSDGSIEYSPIARILPDPVSKPTLTFDINNNLWRINLPPVWQNGDLVVYDVQGRIVYSAILSERSHVDLSRPVTPGIYFISIETTEGSWSDRVVR